MKIYNYPSESAKLKISSIINRGFTFEQKELENITLILEDIRVNGDNALISYINRFDSPDLTIDLLKVTEKEFKDAINNIDKNFFDTLKSAIAQIESFHKFQIQKSWINMNRPGTLLGQLINPVDAAGVYVPGGQAGNTPLVSTVLMCSIPAKIAGVKKIVMVTPSTKDGKINPYLLIAAKEVGVDTIYKAGSAWAIAALAYGTKTIPKVDVIVGPGNIYVTLAKKIVSGTVGIDMIAGPSEILIIADENSNPDFIASDLLSQAEHDALSSSILLTNSDSIAKSVSDAVKKQIENLSRREIACKSLDNYGAILIVNDLEQAFKLANQIAPEHLELHIKDPFAYIGHIRNAGAVFLGEYTPEPVGDYIAGPNHVLPTAGTSRFASALSVDNFIKKTSILNYSEEAFKKESENIMRLAKIEGLDAHANSIQIRLNKN